ncbi:hypothetical protein D3C80_1582230 [compost metagenome]
MACHIHGFDDGIAHRQPVVLLHVGAVQQRVQFLQGPAQLWRIAHVGEVFTHARFETTCRRQAFGGFEHADGAPGIEYEEILYCSHGKYP